MPMKFIFRYVLQGVITSIDLPLGAKFLTLGEKPLDKTLATSLWFEVTPGNELENRKFIALTTGDIVPSNHQYLGSYFGTDPTFHEGCLIHLYEIG